MRTSILSFIATLLLLCSCSDYIGDARLVAAQGLMSEHADSAYAILESIDPTTFSHHEDAALYSLLYAQAQYAKFKVIDDLSSIDAAADFYADNRMWGNYIVALILKGAALEQQDRSQEALSCYKLAECRADTTQYAQSENIDFHRELCMNIIDREWAQRAYTTHDVSLRHNIIGWGGVLLLLVMLYAGGLKWRARSHRRLIGKLQAEAAGAHDALSQHIDAESKLKAVLSDQIGHLRELIDLSYHCGNSPARFLKSFQEKVRLSKLPDNLWKDLQYFVNENYNHVLTRIAHRHPSLTDDELCVIGLTCCQFSYAEISLCMGYSNIYSGNTKRARIAKKMGIEEPLSDYLQRMMTAEGD